MDEVWWQRQLGNDNVVVTALKAVLSKLRRWFMK
jgi:hypothetical protein